MEKPFLSVIIPSYNEQSNLKKKLLDATHHYLTKQAYTFELILADDGSTDGTTQALQAFVKSHAHTKLLELKHKGKGPTVKTAMLDATGRYRLYTDFDQSTPIEELQKMLPFFERGYDMAIGSREVQGAAREREPFYRHLMGKGFNFMVKLLTVRGIHDTQCGFKIMTDELVRDIFPKVSITVKPESDAFTGAFDVELLYLAKKAGYRIAEVPVQWKHVHTQRVSPVKDSLRMLLQLMHIKAAVLLGRYE
jgi:glycosyltransferase involved in cell wall biosynthesis